LEEPECQPSQTQAKGSCPNTRHLAQARCAASVFNGAPEIKIKRPLTSSAKRM
jgi:hypothetical protein